MDVAVNAQVFPLLKGEITLQEALDGKDDVLQKLSYPEKRLDFCGYRHLHVSDMEAIAAHHLGLSAEACSVPWVNKWLHGSFNVCIPIYANGTKGRCDLADASVVGAVHGALSSPPLLTTQVAPTTLRGMAPWTSSPVALRCPAPSPEPFNR